MSAHQPPPVLPPGWVSQWDQNAGRFVFIGRYAILTRHTVLTILVLFRISYRSNELAATYSHFSITTDSSPRSSTHVPPSVGRSSKYETDGADGNSHAIFRFVFPTTKWTYERPTALVKSFSLADGLLQKTSLSHRSSCCQ